MVPAMDLGLSGRTFVVSGASRGLGYAVARALHGEGASVVLAARDPGPLEDAADRLGDGRAFPVAVDLADPSASDLLADAALSRTGRLDGGVCNTGGPSPGSAIEMDDALWRGAFESAFLGPLRLARDLAPRLEPGGSLLFNVSKQALNPGPDFGPYGLPKAATLALMRQYAVEYGAAGIRSNAKPADASAASPASARQPGPPASPPPGNGNPFGLEDRERQQRQDRQDQPRPPRSLRIDPPPIPPSPSPPPSGMPRRPDQFTGENDR